jgi:hypothetical protein
LQNDLAAVLQNRGTAKGGGGDLAGAVADYDAAIGLREAIRAALGEAWPVQVERGESPTWAVTEIQTETLPKSDRNRVFFKTPIQQ